MDIDRINAIRELINEIKDFKLNYNSYIDDSGYTDFIDSIREGKIIALKYFLNYLKLDNL